MSFDNLNNLISRFLVFSSAFCLLSWQIACGGGGSESTQKASNNSPTISLLSPNDGVIASENSPISLTAQASDPEDGDLSESIEWRSDVDGTLGSGSSLTVQLSSGNHTITAIVQDSANQTAQSSVDVEIRPDVGIASISWIPPTQNTDSTQLENLAGFIIYFGESETDLTQSVTIDNPNTSVWLLENLNTDTTYYFAITAFNSQGIESERTEVVSKFIAG